MNASVVPLGLCLPLGPRESAGLAQWHASGELLEDSNGQFQLRTFRSPKRCASVFRSPQELRKCLSLPSPLVALAVCDRQVRAGVCMCVFVCVGSVCVRERAREEVISNAHVLMCASMLYFCARVSETIKLTFQFLPPFVNLIHQFHVLQVDIVSVSKMLMSVRCDG